MGKPKNKSDILCKPAIVLKARELPALICVHGGVRCPLLDAEHAARILARFRGDPTVAVQLVSDADAVTYYKWVKPRDRQADTGPFDRKRDLDVLRKLGLAQGATRRARYLIELLFERIETLNGICAYDTTGWEGCAVARTGIYERVRAQGWQAIVYARTEDDMREARARNAAEIEQAPRLFLRPHHMMCLACWYAGGEGHGPRSNDSLSEILERIRREPDVPITLVEGPCMACDCCDGFFPGNGRCVHSCGLIRDYKKDLDLFQRLGLMPGATMPARDYIARLFDCVHSTREICGYGDGVVTAEEWRICGGPEGNPGYEATRRTGFF